MKLEPSTKFALAVIAGGVAALTAIALEKRYYRQLRRREFESSPPAGANGASRGLPHPTDLAPLRHRLEDRADVLRTKAAELKDRLTDTLGQAEDRLREGASKLRETFQRPPSPEAPPPPSQHPRSTFEGGPL